MDVICKVTASCKTTYFSICHPRSLESCSSLSSSGLRCDDDDDDDDDGNNSNYNDDDVNECAYIYTIHVLQLIADSNSACSPFYNI